MFTWNENDLNPEQIAAIVEPKSVFLQACPGSGKTRTLTYKIAFELSKINSNKRFVVAITYTNRAADEIFDRIQELGVDTSQLWIGTIHSFCLEWILKPYCIYQEELSHGFRVIDSHEHQTILEQICAPYKQPKITFSDCGFFFTTTERRLSCAKKEKHAAINEILGKYFQILEENRQIDFELILYYAFHLIKNHPSICKILSQLFECILVDEYQDTKEIQYSIIASILKSGAGVTRAFVVGDPNQGIYESLGGYPINFADFQEMTGISLIEMRLTKNYRSSEKIVQYFGNFANQPANIDSFSAEKAYQSLISYNTTVVRDELAEYLVSLIQFNIKTLGIKPSEICILAPQWVHLASMTRRLVSCMPEYQFHGPGMVPFARDTENFWYKLAKIALTEASPGLYVRRLRWASEVLRDMEACGIATTHITAKFLLRECNSIKIDQTDGLTYLGDFFDALFNRLEIDFRLFATLKEHHDAFFNSSKARIARLTNEGASFIGDIAAFRKVFQVRTGITISTIHGVKGAEFDSVIAYALLEGMVPHFAEPNRQASATKLLYVIASRARKNLYLISESGRQNNLKKNYQPTKVLVQCDFDYSEVSFQE